LRFDTVVAMGVQLASDLAGNWSWTVWLLVPLALLVALVTAIALGPGSDPPPNASRTRGVGRHLARTADERTA